MELLRVELDRDELEEKSIREHLGVLYVKGGYTLKEGTLVAWCCTGWQYGNYVHMRAWPGQSSHATTKAVTVVWNQTVDGDPCQSLCQDLHVWNQTTTH